MSEKPPQNPQPTIIGSGKTYRIKPAPPPEALKKAQARSEGLKKDSDLTSRLMATLRRSEEASLARRGASATPAPAPVEAEAEKPPEEAPTELSAAVKQRISNLQERNDAVRQAIDNLPAPKTRRR